MSLGVFMWVLLILWCQVLFVDGLKSPRDSATNLRKQPRNKLDNKKQHNIKKKNNEAKDREKNSLYQDDIPEHIRAAKEKRKEETMSPIIETLPMTTPIVYYYTLNSNFTCFHGLPKYLLYTFEQAHMFNTQKTPIIFLTNPNFCMDNYQMISQSKLLTELPSYVEVINIETIKSTKHKLFEFISYNLYTGNGENSTTEISNLDLWVPSMNRFFAIEDLMRVKQYKQVVHLESDNMLYGSMANLVPILSNNFNNLATTQLTQTMMTASLFWVNNLQALERFTTFLSTICDKKTHDFSSSLWFQLISAIAKRTKKLLKVGFPLEKSTFSNANSEQLSNKLPIYNVNEMSLLNFYKHKYPKELEMLPLFPKEGVLARSKQMNFVELANKLTLIKDINVTNKEAAIQHNNEGVVNALGGIFDSGSYGQFLGGIAKNTLRRGFIDVAQLIGKALVHSACTVSMRCSGSVMNYKNTISNSKTSVLYVNNVGSSDHPIRSAVDPSLDYSEYFDNATSSVSGGSRSGAICYTLPYVQCCAGGPGGQDCGEYAPLWNLHIHSKNTSIFVVKPCDC